MKKYLLLLIICCLLLSGCSADKVPHDGQNTTADKAPHDGQTTTRPITPIDWMAGESPVPDNRVGTVRYGLNLIVSANGPNGLYFIKDNYIMYVDNGSDIFIKLCGRPDCTHSNADCNAYVPSRSVLSFYQGYLYVATGEDSEEESKLIRMNPDGSDHKVLLDLLAFAKDHGGAFTRDFRFAEGFFSFATRHWVKESGGDSGDPFAESYRSEMLESYRYRLDGSMEEPEIRPNPNGAPLYYCGDNYFALCVSPSGGDDINSGIGTYDVEKNEVTYLADRPGHIGYYAKTEGYYYKDGAIVRLDYGTYTEEILAQTGLSGDYLLIPLPDCMVLISRSRDGSDKNIYFYNWEYELVDTVAITYPCRENWFLDNVIVAETADKLFLTDNYAEYPLYYINKSELGTGDVQVHEIKYPDTP